MKVFRKDSHLQIFFSDGTTFITDNCTDDMWKFIMDNSEDEDAICYRFTPEVKAGKVVMDRLSKSNVLTLRGNSVYMLDVSEQSIPSDFVEKVLEAEANNDTKELARFRNFWTLVSMNPDARVRNNLFWFIRKWDMRITDSGFIIAYRNADVKQESKYSTQEVKEIINRYYDEKYVKGNDPSSIWYKDNLSIDDVYHEIVNLGKGSPIYTDSHSHTTTIVLGQPVRMPREETDMCQENSCSRGLHVGSKGWLKQGYFGSVGLMVLVNPANVVAVPR